MIAQKEVTTRATASIMVVLEKRVKFLEGGNRLLLYTDEKRFYHLLLLQKILCAAKKSFVSSISNEIIENAAKVEDAIHKWFEKEFSKVARYEKHIQQNWTKRGKIVLKGGVECQCSSKGGRKLSYLPASWEIGLTLSNTTASLILKETALYKLTAKPRFTASSYGETIHETVETVSGSTFPKQKLSKIYHIRTSCVEEQQKTLWCMLWGASVFFTNSWMKLPRRLKQENWRLTQWK